MSDRIPPTTKALEEALELSTEILQDIEKSRVPPGVAALKANRLARLLNDVDHQRVFGYEAAGYPSTLNSFSPDVWRALELAGRTFDWKDPQTGTVSRRAYGESLDSLGETIHTSKVALGTAADGPTSLASANPLQYVTPPTGNALERWRLQSAVASATERLANRRAFIHDYVSRKHFELRFSGIADDVFSRVRATVDARIGSLVPTALQQFSAVHDNLRSLNPEDWANAVHSCRRILQAMADALFPPSAETRLDMESGRPIQLGAGNYINRLVCYVEDRAASERFTDLVGSHLRFLGDRLDAVFEAANKGSHSSVSAEEANRYVVYTYMLVGDLLSLGDADHSQEAAR